MSVEGGSNETVYLKPEVKQQEVELHDIFVTSYLNSTTCIFTNLTFLSLGLRIFTMDNRLDGTF